MLRLFSSRIKHVSEWTVQEIATKREQLQKEMVSKLTTKDGPQSASNLTYEAHMNYLDRNYEFQEQQSLAIDVLSELIKSGVVRVAFLKLEHPGAGLAPLVPMPYVQLVK